MTNNHLRNPITLLKIEYAKFSSYVVVQFLFWLGIALFPIALLSARSVVEDLPPPLPGTSIMYEFPTIWDYTGYIGNWIVWFFFGCIVIFSVTSEVSFRTQRQNIISGYTRRDYFTAKMATVVALSLIATLVYWLTCMVIGWIYTDDPYLSLALDNNYATMRFFLMSIGYLTFALLIAILFRKNGLAVFIYLAYALIFEYIIRGILMGIMYKTGATSAAKYTFWTPLNALEDNMPFPLLRFEQFAQQVASDAGSGDGGPFTFRVLLESSTVTALSLFYIALFVLAAYRLFATRDI